jgi:uncharacterized membrane protein
MAATSGHGSTAAIAGHPVHPMMVTLPIGSAVLALLSDLRALRSGDAADARRSHWLLGACLVTGVLAAPSGAVDALTIRAARESPVTWAHAGGNLAMLAIGLFEWMRRRPAPITATRVSPPVTALMVGILLATGWLGGELAYRKGVGVALTEGSAGGTADGDQLSPASLAGGDQPAEGRPDIPVD